MYRGWLIQACLSPRKLNYWHYYRLNRAKLEERTGNGWCWGSNLPEMTDNRLLVAMKILPNLYACGLFWLYPFTRLLCSKRQQFNSQLRQERPGGRSSGLLRAVTPSRGATTGSTGSRHRGQELADSYPIAGDHQLLQPVGGHDLVFAHRWRNPSPCTYRACSMAWKMGKLPGRR